MSKAGQSSAPAISPARPPLWLHNSARNSTVPDRRSASWHRMHISGSARRLQRSGVQPGGPRDWCAGCGRTDRRSGSSRNWCAGSRGSEQRFPVIPCSGRYIPCSDENKSLFGSSRESGCSRLKSLHELTPADAAMTGEMRNSLLIFPVFRESSKRSPD